MEMTKENLELVKTLVTWEESAYASYRMTFVDAQINPGKVAAAKDHWERVSMRVSDSISWIIGGTVGESTPSD